jgi:hypothetical protein
MSLNRRNRLWPLSCLAPLQSRWPQPCRRPLPSLRHCRRRAFLLVLPLLLPLTSTAEAWSAEALPKQYQAAKKDLGVEYYFLYRVVEKLSRANNLTDNAWNVRLTDAYAMNTFAEGANLIAIPRSELQKLTGDVDAMACMVAREMAHHIRKHKAIGPQEQQALKTAIQEEAKQKVQRNQRSKAGWGALLGIASGVTGIQMDSLSNAISSNTDTATAKMIQDMEAELAQRIAETSARIDKQADEDAFLYLTRAGRDPKGCIRYLDTISRVPGSEPDPNNPQIPGRIQAYRDLVDKESPTKFKKEGQANLSRNSTPLSFQLASDKTYLIINNRRGPASLEIEKF